MLVKICGITREQDALAAAQLGAAALGFVFWPQSPRFVEPERARAIARTLPPFVATVGVFVNETPARVEEIAARVGLAAVQLHGDEAPDECRRLGVRVIKAIPADEPSLASLDTWPPDVTLLLDAADPRRRGGTGRRIDWRLAASIAGRRRVILAGGLTAENVGEAVAAVQPFAVDVSSGVEARPGIKDPERLRRFFEAIRREPDRRNEVDGA